MFLEITIPIVLTVFGVIISVLTYQRNKAKDDKAEGIAIGNVSLSLQHINACMEDVKATINGIKGDLKEYRNELTLVNLSRQEHDMKLSNHEERIRKLEGTK